MSVANWKPQKSDLSERLLHLTCALLSAPYGLDKYEIYNAIKGYRDSLEAGDDSQSIDRKFERDKKSLREMGVLVESYIPASAMENNLETRYRISSDAFLWPKDVVLSPRQLSLLKLAAQAWAHASLSDDASRALNRLRALGISSDDSGLIGLVPRIRTHEPSFFALSEAIDLGKLKLPVYIYGSREDHIVPIGGAYASTQVLPGKKRFVMGASGHIAGVINPPAAKKRSHWLREDGKFPQDVNDWIAGSKELPGSWWTDWSDWLKTHAGKQIPAPKAYGKGAKYKAIEPAPGRYVKAKA